MTLLTPSWNNRLFPLFIGLALALSAWGDGVATAERIRPLPANPFYWEYDGEPLILLGGTDDDNLFQWEQDALTSHLDLLRSAGGNYLRNSMSSRDAGNEEPFLRREDGLYDLEQWNPIYWQKLEALLRLSMERSIIVQIEFWDMHDWYGSPIPEENADYRWNARSLNPKNNVNYTSAESGLPEVIDFGPLGGRADEHPFFRTHRNQPDLRILRRYQERFVRKVLETAMPFPNVLYCINNESAIDPHWSRSWLAFTREIARTAGHEIYIGDMSMIPTATMVPWADFDFADISQSASNLYRSRDSNIAENHYFTIASEWHRIQGRPAPLNSVKQYGGDEIYWTRGRNEGVERVWRSIFAGQAAVRFHRPPSGQGLNEVAQVNLRSLRAVTDLFDLRTLVPHQRLRHRLREREPNEAYLAGHPDALFAVFFTREGSSVELELSAPEKIMDWTLTWLNTTNAEWSAPQTHRGATVQLEKPGAGHWIALLRKVP